MAFDARDFPFGILDVAALLNLKTRRTSGNSIYTDCPLCGDRRGKFNINHEKNVWRCNYCGEAGGMLALYAKVHNIPASEAYYEICEALCTGEKPPVSQPPQPKKPPALQQSQMASAEDIHRTFAALLEMLPLSEQHRQHLRQKRGLTDEQIKALGYKSTPPPYLCRSYTDRLIAQHCVVQGVPGFYLGEDGKWTVKFGKRTAGIIIPARDLNGHIRGVQIRLDTPIRNEHDAPDKEGIKYLSLSSSDKKMGVSSGGLVHFVGDPHARTVYITEGLLKADIAHFLMDRSFAAMAGANNTAGLEPILAQLAANGAQLIIEAQDMDKYRNEHVAGGASKLYLLARKYGMQCRRLTWNPNYKGIDDWQLAMRRKELQRKEVRRMNYKQRYLFGLCDFQQLDSCVEEWNNALENGVSLAAHLGLTDEEYAVFMSQGSQALTEILDRQRRRQRFRIYQLDFSDGKTKDFAYLGVEALHKAGYEQPPAAEYCKVFDGEMICPIGQPVEDVLARLFDRYNDQLPKEYPGRSLSPSDVVELYDEESRRYFYRDKDAFAEVKFSPFLARPFLGKPAVGR